MLDTKQPNELFTAYMLFKAQPVLDIFWHVKSKKRPWPAPSIHDETTLPTLKWLEPRLPV